MPLSAKTMKRGISKAELIRLNDTMHEIMRGDGLKPIAVIEEGNLVPIRKKSRRRARMATSLMRETGVQTKETLDRAIQAILQPIPSLKRNSSPPGQHPRVSLQDTDQEVQLNRTLRPVSSHVRNLRIKTSNHPSTSLLSPSTSAALTQLPSSTALMDTPHSSTHQLIKAPAISGSFRRNQRPLSSTLVRNRGAHNPIITTFESTFKLIKP